MGFELSEINVDYEINEQVEIMNGPFEGFVGTVQEINTEKGNDIIFSKKTFINISKEKLLDNYEIIKQIEKNFNYTIYKVKNKTKKKSKR